MPIVNLFEKPVILLSVVLWGQLVMSRYLGDGNYPEIHWLWQF